jgi:hypothetical protein
MGFFSSLTGKSKPTSSSFSESGFSTLPSELQAPFTEFSTQLTDAFTGRPLATPSAPELDAFGRIGAGIAPTSESLSSDLEMLMNPFDESVIAGINREAAGENSLVNQLATLAGQQGSNRSFLGTSDVEQRRLDRIGQLKQDQFNKSISNILDPIAKARQQDITNLLGQGQLERDIPFSDLQRFGSLLGALPQSGGATSQARGGGKESNIMDTFTSIGTLFSDRRLKENVEMVGIVNGYPTYHFNYIGDDVKYEGVMAQDVAKINPEAIGEKEGFMTVNYDMLGMEMRRV